MARDALAQTRAAVRGMRDAGDDNAPGAAPGLADLDTLLDAVRASGVDVRILSRPPDDALTADGPGGDLPDRPGGADQRRPLRPPAAGRRVDPPHQRRGVHRRHATTARDGSEPVGKGSGIAGMRERAALVGGRLDAGPSPDGLGWRVHAVLPAHR